MDVSDRRMQVQLTQEAKIASDFHFIRAIFAVVGFISALRRSAALLRLADESLVDGAHGGLELLAVNADDDV